MVKKTFNKKRKLSKEEMLFELKKKNPVVAVALSLIINGAGQMYCGKWLRGFAFMLGALLLWMVFMGWIIWIISPIDAYYTALKVNKIKRLELGLDVEEE